MAKGKYDEVKKTLKKAEPEDTAYQLKVVEEKTRLSAATDINPEALAALYFAARDVDDRIEEERYANQITLNAIEQLLIESANRAEAGWGLYGAKPNQVKLSTGDSVFVRSEPKGKVVDKEQFRLWCIKNGLGHELQLWPTRMNAIVKERLLAGATVPEGTAAQLIEKVVPRRAGSKGKDDDD
jgi:hypothetical protein